MNPLKKKIAKLAQNSRGNIIWCTNITKHIYNNTLRENTKKNNLFFSSFSLSVRIKSGNHLWGHLLIRKNIYQW